MPATNVAASNYRILSETKPNAASGRVWVRPFSLEIPQPLKLRNGRHPRLSRGLAGSEKQCAASAGQGSSRVLPPLMLMWAPYLETLDDSLLVTRDEVRSSVIEAISRSEFVGPDNNELLVAATARQAA